MVKNKSSSKLNLNFILKLLCISCKIDCEDKIAAKDAECNEKIDDFQDECNRRLICVLGPGTPGCPTSEQIRSFLRNV